jgi:hypothetical protein
MRKRYILDRPFGSSDDRVGCTVIASWLPWKYWIISTIHIHSSQDKPMREFGAISLPRLPGIRECYVTQIFRCDPIGVTKNMDEVYYEKEYESFEEAQTGHNEVVDKLFSGNLKLKKVNKFEDLFK